MVSLLFVCYTVLGDLSILQNSRGRLTKLLSHRKVHYDMIYVSVGCRFYMCLSCSIMIVYIACYVKYYGYSLGCVYNATGLSEVVSAVSLQPTCRSHF